MQDKSYMVQEEPNYSGLEEKINSLNNSNNTILKKLNYVKLPIENFKYNFREYKRYKKQYIASLLATISCFSVAFIIDLNIRYKYYDAIEYEYSVEDGLTEENKRIKLKDYEGNKVYIKEFKIIDGVEQEIKSYDVSDIKLDNIEDYMTYDVSNLEPEETYDEPLKEELNSKDIRKIIKLDVNNEKEKRKNSMFFTTVFNYWLLDIFPFKKNMNGKRDDMKCSKEDALRIMRMYLYKPIDEIIDEINNNDKLRDDFIKLFNENKYLLNDPTLLEEKYNELIQSLNTTGLKEDIKVLKNDMNKLL